MLTRPPSSARYRALWLALAVATSACDGGVEAAPPTNPPPETPRPATPPDPSTHAAEHPAPAPAPAPSPAQVDPTPTSRPSEAPAPPAPAAPAAQAAASAPTATAPSAPATVKTRTLWFQIDAPLRDRGQSGNAELIIESDGAVVERRTLRRAGNRRSHLHYGRFTVPIQTPDDTIELTLRTASGGAAVSETIDLGRGTFFIVKRSGDAGPITLTQRRTKPLYK